MGEQKLVGIKLMCLNSKVNDKQSSLTDRIYSTNGILTAITTTQFFMPNFFHDNREDEIII